MHSFMYLFRRHVGSFKVMLAVVFNMHLSLFFVFFFNFNHPPWSVSTQHCILLSGLLVLFCPVFILHFF